MVGGLPIAFGPAIARIELGHCQRDQVASQTWTNASNWSIQYEVPPTRLAMRMSQRRR